MCMNIVSEIYDIIEEKLLIDKQNYINNFMGGTLSDQFIFDYNNLKIFFNILNIPCKVAMGFNIGEYKLWSSSKYQCELPPSKDGGFR